MIAELDLMKSQTRLAMDRLGERHPNDLEGMKGIGAYAGLAKAREMGSEGILQLMEKVGLRGRGGAATVAISWLNWPCDLPQRPPCEEIASLLRCLAMT